MNETMQRDRRDAFPEKFVGISEMEKKILIFNERKKSSLIRTRQGITPTVPGQFSGKASLRFRAGFRQASLTLESACVLPLFLFGLITMIFFMDIYRAETVHLTALCQRAKTEGLAAYRPSGGGAEEVTVTDAYSYRPVQLLLPLPAIPVTNRITVHAWTGTDRFGAEYGTGEPERMVLVTETGHVIHLDPDCSYLHLTVHAVSGSTVAGLRNSSGGKYHACERCSFHQPPGTVVYITEQGSRYHNLGSCSGLKRTIRLIRESEAEGYHLCSRCGHS